MSRLSEAEANRRRLTRRAEQIQARYGGIVKQIQLVLDDMGDRDLSSDVAEGRISITPIESPMVLTELPAGAFVVCCGGVSRRRRGSPFTFLVERTKDVATPMGPQDATSPLLPKALRKDTGPAVPTRLVHVDRDSGLPDQVRSKRKSKSE